MTSLWRSTGLDVVGVLPWGTHYCHFFQTQGDLLEILVPYFKAGLEIKEFCLWVIHEPLTERTVRRALKQGVPDGDRYLADGSLEIVSSREWYFKGGRFSLKRVVRQWDEKLAKATARGYAGLRANGNVAWLQRKHWRRFQEYERTLNEALAQKPMLVMCSYSLHKTEAVQILDVARAHQFAIAKRTGNWEVLVWRTPLTSQDRYTNLTAREREVLLLVAEGLTSPQIARRLSISTRTVESHRARLMQKLDLRNQAGVVRYALERGLLSIESRRR